jgi:hypothetical protein
MFAASHRAFPGLRLGILVAVAWCVACAETDYELVDWQLDLVSDQVQAIASARVCSTRALAQDFMVMDEHLVMPGLPNDGDVQVVVDVFDEQGERIGSSGPVLLEQPLFEAKLLRCSFGECDSPCAAGSDINGGERTVAIRFLEDQG